MKQLKIDVTALILTGLLFFGAACSSSSTPAETETGRAVFTSAGQSAVASGKGCSASYRLADAYYAALGQLKPAEMQIAKYVRRIFQDKKGDLWFGTNQFGVCRYDGQQLRYFSTAEGLGGTQVTGIMEDQQGRLWLTTNGGVSVYDGETFTNYTQKDGLPSNWAWSILEDRSGQIWVGTLEGLCRYEGGQFVPVAMPLSDAPEPPETLDTDRVMCIAEDDAGHLWIGTDGSGLYRYDGIKLRNYNELDGLVVPAVQEVFEDRMGRIWAGGGGGLYRLDGTRFTNVKKGGPWDNC